MVSFLHLFVIKVILLFGKTKRKHEKTSQLKKRINLALNYGRNYLTVYCACIEMSSDKKHFHTEFD